MMYEPQALTTNIQFMDVVPEPSTRVIAKTTGKQLPMIVWILAAIALPQITVAWNPMIGIYATVLGLMMLLVLALRNDAVRDLAIAAALLPVSMIVSLSLPQPNAFMQAGVFYSSLLLLIFLCSFTSFIQGPIKLPLAATRYWLTVPLMAAIGGVVGEFGYGMLRHAPFAYHGIAAPLVVIAAVLFAAIEELLFRGVIQEQSKKRIDPIVAPTIATIAYASLYVTTGTALSAAFAVISGAILSTIYYYKPNIVLTSVVNAAMKIAFFSLLAAYVLH